ncbi:cysteine--tRNA ligase [Synechococcus sp. Cruz-9H2]|uniref:cysteine--tRNA ligase n=1 Tax=unclassified Synechococcus TaxID=2626047 RepID=UPI0020CE56B7|nr:MULTISPECIES: cysteine--tRNA ligase [unclassified Synechococcus]MCP9820618.1 cysteine--tRNA ligase [Synechococcus sp. Cruz-9H2]MCP9844872.1 cysteine--tRNA ligase [Synechococcus sp. Edmonson 11F2]MCP9856993.1 cysteine--tRNA ligase [Synechococcus sp. Cruz-9C9]MCP9864280.1 cysteine--tRNA ligase [Synechococcus sp. Cruz-7E5]MCP9871548.1 cysteine--tRNA ligase [Synechococcus sp. Cruz-7B9]
MSLRLTNTLTRRTESFQPLVPGEVSIYCCGVTVYDLCHLGHARSYIVWDVLRRYLIWSGYRVTFVQNITDIDDKIIQRAAKEGRSMEEVSESNIVAFQDDMAALNILPPDRVPRATQCLDGIRAMIAELEASGAAYSADGDVYFAVMGQPDYGKLSGRSLSEQQEGASGRLNSEEESRKRHPFDFALWKGVKPGEPSFPSPWGPGRPGWHIECSAMVRQELGNTIDIHLGGADLIFPHHENEIAQSEAANAEPLARYWLHNGMVNVDGEKMSKSLGNFTTIRSLLASGVSPMTLRLFVLQAHYRKPLDFTREALDAAATGWHGLNEALQLGLNPSFTAALGWAAAAASAQPVPAPDPDPGHGLDVGLETSRQGFIDALDDDLNTSAALAVLFELARPLRALARRLERGSEANGEDRALQARWQLLKQLSGVLGLEPEVSPSSAAEAATGPDPVVIQTMISERLAARQQKRYPDADAIRDRLRAEGIELIDRPDGSTEWIRR